MLSAEFVEPELRQALDYFSSIILRANIIFYFATVVTSILGFVFSARLISPIFAARDKVETIVKRLMQLASGVAILTTVGIILSLTFEAAVFLTLYRLKIFYLVPIGARKLLFVMARPEAQGFRCHSAICWHIDDYHHCHDGGCPDGLMSAVYLSEYASKRLRNLQNLRLNYSLVFQLLYMVFAALFVAPFFKIMGVSLGWIYLLSRR